MVTNSVSPGRCPERNSLRSSLYVISERKSKCFAARIKVDGALRQPVALIAMCATRQKGEAVPRTEIPPVLRQTRVVQPPKVIANRRERVAQEWEPWQEMAGVTTARPAP